MVHAACWRMREGSSTSNEAQPAMRCDGIVRRIDELFGLTPRRELWTWITPHACAASGTSPAVAGSAPAADRAAVRPPCLQRAGKAAYYTLHCGGSSRIPGVSGDRAEHNLRRTRCVDRSWPKKLDPLGSPKAGPKYGRSVRRRELPRMKSRRDYLAAVLPFGGHLHPRLADSHQRLGRPNRSPYMVPGASVNRGLL